MYSESPSSSPDVDCYEECVITDEFFVPPSPLSGTITPRAESPFTEKKESITDRVGIPKSTSGRVTKKGVYTLVYYAACVYHVYSERSLCT